MQKIKIISLLIALIMNRLVYAIDIDADGELEKEIQRLQEEKKLWIETVSKQKEAKDAAAGVVSVITQDEIKRYGGRSLADVLNRVTSMYVLGTHVWEDSMAAQRGDVSTQVNNHTLFLLDGRPLRDSWHGGLNNMVIRNFPLHQIEQIEVVRGSGSVLYGSNGYSAVVNIITRKNKDNSLTVRGRYGSFGTGQAESEFAWKNAEASVTGAARYRDTRGWQASAIDEKNTPISFHNSSEDISAATSAQWGNFNLNAFVANMHNTHWGVTPVGNGDAVQYRRLFVDAGHKAELNSHWNFQTNLTYNNAAFTVDLAAAEASDIQHLAEDNLLIEQTHFFNFFDKKLTFLMGGLVEWQSGTVTQPKGVTPLLKYGFLKSSLYGELTYAILDNLKFTAGGKWNRGDDIGSASNGKALNGQVGRLALVYEINKSFGIKVLYNQAFRTPSALESKINVPSVLVGNPSLEPERVEGIDAQFFYHTVDYQASFTAFRSRQSHLIARTVLPAPQTGATYGNVGSAVFHGLELDTKAKLFEKLHWTGSYTFQTNRDQLGRNNFLSSPNHIAKMGLSYDVTPQLQLSVFDTFFSNAKKFPGVAQVNPTADSYHNVTVNGNYRLDELLGSHFAKHVTLTMYVDNLLNEKIYYPEFNRKRINTIPASGGRSIFGEIAIEF
jgi:outer membrane receptor for ferrienterochelin and colicin